MLRSHVLNQPPELKEAAMKQQVYPAQCGNSEDTRSSGLGWLLGALLIPH